MTSLNKAAHMQLDSVFAHVFDGVEPPESLSKNFGAQVQGNFNRAAETMSFAKMTNG